MSSEPETMLSRLERVFNRLSDQDWSWWPLVSLRPAPNQPIGLGVFCKLTLCFGGLSSLLVVLLLVLYQVPLTPLRIVYALLLGTIGYLSIYGLSFLWAWNRRATRLAQTGDGKTAE
ncbi:hypothetical protein MIB92_17875 [Aestuariirhabdus sp. Z084]|uniref:hypothetical protein n=1 Tax=Aestuariirhabdus haliotis TaxID=2918751 RepID=UPI00201B37BD|nr:hypothetical protein [Aestuariirhabdus haliotis]MCL6417534.1 hypothetical protein [Aestuariirhabdus haliotis]MCL6421477.1 hypothetical protein [Aestuariirhabdus haliotis]